MEAVAPFRVIGVDPSLSATGVAYDNGDLSTVKTTPKLGAARLATIYDAVYAAAGSGYFTARGNTWPLLAVIEDLPTHAMSAGLTGQAQGVVRLALVRAGASILTVAPASLKVFATGSGRADKAAMMQAWADTKQAEAGDDNQADAGLLREYGVALMDEALELRTDERLMRMSAKVRGRDLEIARKVAAGWVIQ